MKVETIEWVLPGDQVGLEGGTCSGKSIAKSSGRKMRCSKPGVIWLLIVFDDGTRLPKILCDKHIKRERNKWGGYAEIPDPPRRKRERKVQPADTTGRQDSQ